MHPVEAEIVGVVERSIINHPRSLQTAIGPSALGTPCDRRLAHELAATPAVNDRGAAWKPTVGQALHAHMEVLFYNDNLRRVEYPAGDDCWLTETRIDCGDIAGVPLAGSCDLFHVPTGTPVDWKFVTRNKVREYRANGPGDLYRVQSHLYGLGFERAGYEVNQVAVFFWTRDGEFTDRYYWTEPYDRQVALDAMDRATRIRLLHGELGDYTFGLMPTNAGSYCLYCPVYQPGAIDLRSACPGDAATQSRTAAPLTLADALGN